MLCSRMSLTIHCLPLADQKVYYKTITLINSMYSYLSQPDPSFQVLHARYSLERTLENFLRRGAVFDVVFWESMAIPLILSRQH